MQWMLVLVRWRSAFFVAMVVVVVVVAVLRVLLNLALPDVSTARRASLGNKPLPRRLMLECYLRPHDTFSLVGRDLVPSWVDRKALGLGQGAVRRRYKVGSMHFRAELSGYVVGYSAMSWAVRGREMGVRSSKIEMTRGEGILYWPGRADVQLVWLPAPTAPQQSRPSPCAALLGRYTGAGDHGCDDLGQTRTPLKSPEMDACMAAARYNNASMVQA